MKSVLVVMLILFFSAIASAEECNTTLKDSDTYQQLSIILNCLSSKIEKLEKDIKNIKSNEGGQLENNKEIALLDNRVITIYDLKLTRKEKKIFVSFVIRSKSDKDIYMAVLHDSPIITDETGQASNNCNIIGMRDIFKSQNENDYTVLNPGIPTPVSISFEAEKIKGKEISLRVGLLHLQNEKVDTYSFGKTKILLE